MINSSMEAKKLIDECDKFMRQNIPKSRITRNGSDEVYLTHVLGVKKYGLILAKYYEADQVVIEIAALLHDISADSRETHAIEGARVSEKFLSSLNVSAEIKGKIIRCIEHHSIGSSVGSIEEQIIQDADGISFIEDTFKFFFEKQKQKYSLEEARTKSMRKTEEMMKKIKTKEGIKIASALLKKAITYLESAA